MPLQLFPNGLDGTLLVPVLLGVLVMAALTEWWGWDFVGLVVPGYLCSVLLLQPWVAGVVLVEAILTYGFVKLLDVGSTRVGFAFPVFGRDRFFLVLAASIAVRVALEGWALQWLAELAQPRWPEIAAHRSELFGIGVVLVPLAANRLWRPGLRSGLLQLGVQTGIVWAVVALLLTRYTNFSIAGFDLAYDHLALSFVSSPRAQILLLVTAALASTFNRRYGWDFHGILVPALLALAISTPLKLVATVAESFFIILLAKLILRLPSFRRSNVEGPRKLVLCFLVGFALKVLVASLISDRYPGYRPSDFFGLGYVLPSLLAERVWLKGNLPLVLVPTVQTAIVGVVEGALLVLLLMWVAPPIANTSDMVTERYANLPQAIAALRTVAGRSGEPDLTDEIEQARRGTFRARSDDGYGLVFDDARPGLIALPPSASTGSDKGIAVMVCEPNRAEEGAWAAAERHWALVVAVEPAASEAARRLGTAMPCEEALRRDAEPTPPTATARTTILEPFAPTAMHLLPPTPAPARAVAEAAHRIQDARSDPHKLAHALSPLGLSVRPTTDGLLVLQGPGWPQVLLRPNADSVVASPHAREIDAAPAALFAAEQLRADCVLPGAGADGESALLAMALAEPLRRPLLLVRGTEQLASDALLLLQPEQDAASWLEPFLSTLKPRFEVARQVAAELAPLQAFPPRAGQAGSAALLWLSASARRVLAGSASDLDRPDLLALASERKVPVVRDDVAEWISRGSGAPEPDLTALAERLARTRDVALLRRPPRGHLALFIDDKRGLSGFAVESSGRRAVALCGERRRGSATIDSIATATRAIASGTSLLLARGAQR
ncbi:MAG TPA: poly-gamma-glutamate biosynthesis protein PgsC/CapC [Myxococcales bacterium]|jgi:hypothetical protein